MKHIEIIEASGIPYELVDFKVNALGLTTNDKIYLSNDLGKFNPTYAVYVVLHEMAHYKRIKNGDAPNLDELVNGLFGDFFEKVMIEERIAERYAQINFFKINGFEADSFLRLKLDDPYLAKLYEMTYNQVKASGLGYYEFLINNIINQTENA